ncbi:protein RER1-like [Dysidea avara]|uniref:protein RER1-like n=1 Tax=Dysidea avara TaxID=196820 RepID=UPI003323BC5F
MSTPEVTTSSDSSSGWSPGVVTGISQRYQKFLDDITRYRMVRWVVACLLVVVYAIRVYLLQGWHIISYALAIYILNLFILFLSPKIDPAFEDDDWESEGPSLPTKATEEFRPFIRRLPEFKFWHNLTRGVLFALLLTCFEMFNIPVFWPILVLYFILLFTVTMKRQITHMIKYRYLPFSYGKRRYKGKEDTGHVIQQ